MTYQDKEIHCGDCGTRFGFSAEEQMFYADKGLDHEPRRCKACRMARKARRRDGEPGSSCPRQVSHDGADPQGGIFVRRSWHNSHQRPDDRPWKQSAGVYQPRHGHKVGGRGNWRQRQERVPEWAQPGWQDPRGKSRDGAPLFKADFGPSSESREGLHRHGRSGGTQGNRRNPQRDGGGPQKPLVLHDAVCADCRTETQVPFKPNGVLPVYCRTCLPRHKPRRTEARRGKGGGRQQPRA